MLTGAALGILLIYLLDEAVAADLGPRRRGPIEGPSEIEISPFRSAVGRIDVAPLEEIALGGVPGRRNPIPTADDPGPAGGVAAGLLPATARRGYVPAALSPQSGLPNPALSLGGGGRSGTAGGGSVFIRVSNRPGSSEPQPVPTPDSPDTPIPPPTSRELPEVILVLVRTDANAAGRSLEGLAESNQTLSQRGIEFSRIDFQRAGGTTLEVLSDRRLQGSGIAQLSDASLSVIATNTALVASQLLGGSQGDVFILSARDLIQLGLLSNAQADASLQSSTASMVGSSLVDPSGNNLITLQANTQLSFIGVGESQNAALAFDLLTQGLRDSLVDLGNGDDSLSIVSGFRGALGTIGVEAGAGSRASGGNLGLAFDLPDAYTLLADRNAWSFRLKTTAIGLQDSSISTGGGNDEVTIFTRIDEDLRNNLGPLYNSPTTTIEQARIGMLRSTLAVGAGNDVVKINGDVIDSTISLGDGNNFLILEGSLLGESQILTGQGRNQISINGNLGAAVQGGNGDDVFSLNPLALAGQLDGGGGNDTLSSGSNNRRDLALIQGRNQGVLAGLHFRSIENLDVGGGDDVVLMSLEGTLSGILLGGDGLDRLEFSNWTLPVTVDLDLGSASAIYGGARGGLRGFEQVIGGLGNDVLSSSGVFSGLDGGEGDDVLYMRWTPWLSSPEIGLQLRGGGGRDVFVIAGLESAIPPDWDGVSGIPSLTDLQLDPETTSLRGADRLGWMRQVVAADGSNRQEFISLTPSGPEGLGNIKLLPIAPLEQLLSGMSEDTRQLAVAWDPSHPTSAAELRLLGADGPGTSRLIAYLPPDVQIPERHNTGLS